MFIFFLNPEGVRIAFGEFRGSNIWKRKGEAWIKSCKAGNAGSCNEGYNTASLRKIIRL